MTSYSELCAYCIDSEHAFYKTTLSTFSLVLQKRKPVVKMKLNLHSQSRCGKISRKFNRLNEIWAIGRNSKKSVLVLPQ
jgi:hypothetical protein